MYTEGCTPRAYQPPALPARALAARGSCPYILAMADAPATPLQKLVTHKAAFWLVALSSLVADLASKVWADVHVRPTDPDVTPVVPGFLSWKWAENQGAAFSVLHGNTGVLSLIAGGVLLVVLWYAFRAPRTRPVYLAALGLVASGAVGNLYDRIRLGYVRDFIFFDFDLPLWGPREFLGFAFEIPRRWPVFNVADIAIMVGVGLLAVLSLRKPAEDAKPVAAKPAEAGHGA